MHRSKTAGQNSMMTSEAERQSCLSSNTAANIRQRRDGQSASLKNYKKHKIGSFK
jgi:hypothetical protein